MSLDIFKDWLPSINQKTSYLFQKGKEDDVERGYPAYMINRALSQFEDTIFVANEMNRSSLLDPKMQYDFYYYLIPKRKRFAPWAKASKNENINIIQEAYKVSTVKAEEISLLLSEDDIEQLKTYLFKGGNNGKDK
jgi:Bacteriophage clamp loader A subunit